MLPSVNRDFPWPAAEAVSCTALIGLCFFYNQDITGHRVFSFITKILHQSSIETHILKYFSYHPSH